MPDVQRNDASRKRLSEHLSVSKPHNDDSAPSTGAVAPHSGDPYILETVSRACDVLQCFPDGETSLKLRDIVQQTGLNKTIAFRILHTLVERGLLERSVNLDYKSKFTLTGRSRFKIGYAAQSGDSSFSAAVTAGIRLAAARRQIELIYMDNHWSAAIALKNAQHLAASGIDLALNFQTHTKIASAVSAVFKDAGIPLVAIEIAHPDSVFYGADNYRAGRLAGRVLGNWSKKRWNGQVQQVLLLEAAAAGSLPQLRLTGARAGIREFLPHLSETAFVSLEVTWDFLRAFEAVRKYLRRTAPGTTLITGVNDMMVLGALRAFEEAGRSQECVAVSMGATPEARAELHREETRLVGAIAFFPERYGEDIIQIALDILHHCEVQPAVYAHHDLITATNVDKLYPIEAHGEIARKDFT